MDVSYIGSESPNSKVMQALTLLAVIFTLPLYVWYVSSYGKLYTMAKAWGVSIVLTATCTAWLYLLVEAFKWMVC